MTEHHLAISDTIEIGQVVETDTKRLKAEAEAAVSREAQKNLQDQVQGKILTKKEFISREKDQIVPKTGEVMKGHTILIDLALMLERELGKDQEVMKDQRDEADQEAGADPGIMVQGQGNEPEVMKDLSTESELEVVADHGNMHQRTLENIAGLEAQCIKAKEDIRVERRLQALKSSH